jgi:hypothetical protein
MAWWLRAPSAAGSPAIRGLSRHRPSGPMGPPCGIMRFAISVAISGGMEQHGWRNWTGCTAMPPAQRGSIPRRRWQWRMQRIATLSVSSQAPRRAAVVAGWKMGHIRSRPRSARGAAATGYNHLSLRHAAKCGPGRPFAGVQAELQHRSGACRWQAALSPLRHRRAAARQSGPRRYHRQPRSARCIGTSPPVARF